MPREQVSTTTSTVSILPTLSLAYLTIDVGLPRAYKWINTINLAKTWEQLNIARSFNTTQIWIVNVGSLKPLEMPSEHFLSLAYDFDQWDRNSARRFLREWAGREFGQETKDEVADIMMLYSVGHALRCMAPLTLSDTPRDLSLSCSTLRSGP